jgi:enoyl-CoA hydratase/carnithine racemase
MTMAYQMIGVEQRGSAEILTLDRPASLNALSPQMVDELTDYFTSLTMRIGVRVVVLRAAGRRSAPGST